MEYNGYFWLIVIAVCIIIEASTLGLTTIWFAIGALIAWFIYLSGLSLQIQIVVFLLVSIACLILTRPIAVEKLKIGKVKTNLKLFNSYWSVVETTINNVNSQGYVKLKGQIWSARSIDDEVIEKDELVVVEEIKGVKLIVKRKQGGNEWQF